MLQLEGSQVRSCEITFPKTIALDTFFLVKISDRKEEYDAIRRLLKEQALIPVVSRAQVAEMVWGSGSVERGKQLLLACQGPVYELSPFYYLMQAEAYAGLAGLTVSRRGLIGMTEWEATQNLLRQIPSTLAAWRRPRL